MRRVGRLSSGAEEWACPTCGRREARFGPPEPRSTVLEEGDDSAVHIAPTTAGPGPATAAGPAERYGLGPVQEIPRPPSLPMLPVDPAETAARDRAWLAEIGIDWNDDEAA